MRRSLWRFQDCALWRRPSSFFWVFTRPRRMIPVSGRAKRFSRSLGEMALNLMIGRLHRETSARHDRFVRGADAFANGDSFIAKLDAFSLGSSLSPLDVVDSVVGIRLPDSYPAYKTRLRSRSNLARPYICRLISFKRLTCPST